jgi:hypothetical protein
LIWLCGIALLFCMFVRARAFRFRFKGRDREVVIETDMPRIGHRSGNGSAVAHRKPKVMPSRDDKVGNAPNRHALATSPP